MGFPHHKNDSLLLSSHGSQVGSRRCLPESAGSRGTSEFPSPPQPPQVAPSDLTPLPPPLPWQGLPLARPATSTHESTCIYPKKAKEEPSFPPSITTHEFCSAPVKPAQELSLPLVGTRQVTPLWLSRNLQCREQQHGPKGAKSGPNAFPIDTLKTVES